ncbi:MAG: S41 family peptidase [Patescibacteria group bacterium]|nr:S41 family peptidase [Patescibacteria group bacterium]
MKINWSKYFPLTVLLGCVFSLGIFVGQNFNLPFGKAPFSLNANEGVKIFNKEANKSIDFSLFWKVWDELEKQYVNKKAIDSEKMLYGAISGMTSSLGDPYTTFLDPSQNKEFDGELSGTYEGVGIQLGFKDKQLVVMAPLAGTPAESAGVKAGDLIIKISDKDTVGMTLPEAVTLIRGPAGTSIKLTMLHLGGDKPYDASITREKIKVKSVELTRKDGDIAYVKLSRFGDTTNDEWDSVIKEVSSANYKGMVLDLRNNPGGHLQSAVYIASEFLKKDEVVVQEEASDGSRELLKVNRDGKLLEIPLTVLINKGSASASEIVSGALADHQRATLVGEDSFGKGTVQAVEEFENGAGLHVTVAKWLTPNGTWVNEKGLSPNVKVTLSTDDVNTGKDPQLDKTLELLKK